VSIILKRSVNYFGNFGVECHLLKKDITSLVSPNIRGINVIYPNYYYTKSKVTKNFIIFEVTDFE
jgi:hypothetical protein